VGGLVISFERRRVFYHGDVWRRSLLLCALRFIFEYLPENLGGMNSGSDEDAEGEECL